MGSVRSRYRELAVAPGEISVTNEVGVGQPAPDFSLPDQSGTLVRLSAVVAQQVVVLFFYPKDNTPGCIAEVCSFRDSYEVFSDAGARVIGISSDSVASHQGFASKYHLPFTLVSD